MTDKKEAQEAKSDQNHHPHLATWGFFHTFALPTFLHQKAQTGTRMCSATVQQVHKNNNVQDFLSEGIHVLDMWLCLQLSRDELNTST